MATAPQGSALTASAILRQSGSEPRSTAVSSPSTPHSATGSAGVTVRCRNRNLLMGFPTWRRRLPCTVALPRPKTPIGARGSEAAPQSGGLPRTTLDHLLWLSDPITTLTALLRRRPPSRSLSRIAGHTANQSGAGVQVTDVTTAPRDLGSTRPRSPDTSRSHPPTRGHQFRVSEQMCARRSLRTIQGSAMRRALLISCIVAADRAPSGPVSSSW